MPKVTEQTSPNDLSLSTDEQDVVIYKMIKDKDFLGNCYRRKIKPDYFAGDARQLVVGKAYDFYEKFKESPGEAILSLFDDSRKKKRIAADKYDIVVSYIGELADTAAKAEENSNGYLVERLDEFVKRRIAFTASNDILARIGTAEYDPNIILDIMRNALDQLDECNCKMSAEDMREDELVTQTGDVVVNFGIPTLDNPLGGGLHLGQFIIIQAFTSRGKSQCIIHLAKRAVRSGNSCLVVPTEMSNRTWKLRWKSSVTALGTSELRNSPKEYQRMRKQVFMRKSSLYLLDEEEKSMSVDALGAVIDNIKQRDGREIKLLLLDSADDLRPPGRPSRDKIENSTATYTFLKNFAKDRNICVVTTSQSQRAAAKRWWAGSDNIGDDINKVRKAHVGISINARDSELQKNYARLFLFKHTDGPVGAKCWIRNDYGRGQFGYYSQEYDHTAYKEIMKKEGILTNENS
jgi:replicative DNA helicase